MKLSIIIPIYKVEEYLRKCVDSLIAQNLEDTEILLVDDGSPDGCGKICDEYSEKYPYIKALHKENGGLSDARNFGIKQAVGDYIIFIDSDDYVNDDFKKIYNYLDGNIDVVVFGWDVETLKTTYRISNDEEKVFSGKDICNAVDICSKKNSACIKAINRKFLLDNKLFFEKGFAEDFNWTGRIYCHASSIKNANLVYYHYIAERPGSIMNVCKKQRFYDVINHAKSILKEADAASINNQLRDKVEKYIAFNIIRNFKNVNKLSKLDRKEILQLLRENKTLVKKQGTFATKLFMFVANVLGFDFAYRLVG